MGTIVSYIQAKNGDTTLKIDEYFVHSQYNPIREAQQIAKKHYMPNYAHIVFGYGCGYVVDALLEEMQFNEPFIIVDPLFDENLLTIKKSHEHLHLFNSNVLSKFEFFLSELLEDVRTSIKVICLSNYEKVFPEQYKLFLQKIKDIQNRHRVNDHTLIRYAQTWQVNIMENLFTFAQDRNLQDLNKKYSQPVVMVAGGPSLNKQIPILQDYRDQLIIVAAGSTINSLLAAGIEPDYVVSIDGGAPNAQHFAGLQIKNTRLLYSIQNHPDVRDAFQSECYVFDLKGYPLLSKYMQEQLQLKIPLFEGGGSVAHVAFEIAQFLTNGPIALIGQDLAYTDNLTHAKHNRHARAIDEQFIEQMEAFQTKGYNQDDVWTNPIFYSMKLEFEELIKINYPENEFYNCTEGGIILEGYKQIPFQDFCQRYAITPISPTNKEYIKKVNFDPKKELAFEIKQYKKLIQLLTDGLEALAMNRLNAEFENRTLIKLEKVEKAMKEILPTVPIEPITAPITLRTLRGHLPSVNETKKEAYNRVMNQTKDLYRQMLDAIKYVKLNAEDILNKHEQ